MLPLPDLAARRWRDLVDEGVTLLPRYAPGWTDYNATDPGITLLELVAWLVEAGLYRADRVPDRHRRAFLRALGTQAAGAQPAQVVLEIRPAPTASPLRLPAETVFVNSEGVAVTTAAEVAFGTGAGAELVRVAARQTVRATGSMPVTAAVAPAGIPDPGTAAVLTRLAVDPAGRVTELVFAPPGGGVDGQAPEVTLLEFVPPTSGADGLITMDLVVVATSGGEPGTAVPLPGDGVAAGVPEVWTAEAAGWHRWRAIADLGAARRRDAVFQFDAGAPDGPDAPVVRFGDGEHGRVPPPGAAILARWERTRGAGGNAAAQTRWEVADSPWNTAHLRGGVAGTRDQLVTAVNTQAATGGADAETADEALARVTDLLWAHEYLLEVAGGAGTLDQLDPDTVRAVPAPDRAATALDFERLAVDVAGVARARALPGFDADHPGLAAPGTVSVLVAPANDVVLDAVRHRLEPHRLLGTRLVVRAAELVAVQVSATLVPLPGGDVAGIGAETSAALQRFLDPVAGGPAGRGWPFGRAVYRAEVLALLARVPGVDFVASLDIRPDGASPGGCADVCIGPHALASPGARSIVVSAGPT